MLPGDRLQPSSCAPERWVQITTVLMFSPRGKILLNAVARLNVCLFVSGEQSCGLGWRLCDSIFRKTNGSSSGLGGGAQQGLRGGLMRQTVQAGVISSAG